MLIQRSVSRYPARDVQKLFRALMLWSPAVASPHTLITRHVSQKPAPKFPSKSVQTDIPRPISQVDPKIIEKSSIASLSTLRVLGKKLEQIGVEISPCTPGQRNHLLCPLCNGGTSTELSLSVSITADGNTALFKCFRAKCGWEGCIKAFADSKSTYEKMIHTPKVKKIRTIKEESLQLEPLCDELRLTSKALRVTLDQSFPLNNYRSLKLRLTSKALRVTHALMAAGNMWFQQ